MESFGASPKRNANADDGMWRLNLDLLPRNPHGKAVNKKKERDAVLELLYDPSCQFTRPFVETFSLNFC